MVFLPLMNLSTIFPAEVPKGNILTFRHWIIIILCYTTRSGERYLGLGKHVYSMALLSKTFSFCFIFICSFEHKIDRAIENFILRYKQNWPKSPFWPWCPNFRLWDRAEMKSATPKTRGYQTSEGSSGCMRDRSGSYTDAFMIPCVLCWFTARR